MTITKEQLLDLIKDTICVYVKDESLKYGNRYFSVIKRKVSLDDFDKYFFHHHWCTGGITGGSCWDEGGEDNHRAYHSDDTEPEFTEIDFILEKLCPNISFLKYKNFMSGLNIYRDSYSENEYYGNSTDYAYKTIELKHLLEKLNELLEK